MDLNTLLYTDAQLQAVIDDRKKARLFFLESFGMQLFSDTENIIFERIQSDDRITPFVSPLATAIAATSRGHTAEMFRPAYLKPKDVISPQQVTVRRAGEALTGSLSPKQRYLMALLAAAERQRNTLIKTQEVMARDLLRNGYLIVEGEQYPAMKVDFHRKAENSGAVAPVDAWDKAGADTAPSSPVEQLQDWLMSMEHPTARIIIGKGAYKYLMQDPKWEKLQNKDYRGNATDLNFDFTQMALDQTIFHGTIGISRIPVFSTSATYEVEKRTVNGVTTEVLPYVEDNEIYLLPHANHGTRCYAIIQDAKANYEARTHFYKHWIPDDPSIPHIMTQSSPLPVHHHINSTLCKQVY